MKSQTKIKKLTRKKNNAELVETLSLARKHKAWFKLAHLLSMPTKKRPSFNLEEINKESKERETVVIPGKVLSVGEIDKKIKIVAFSFSEKAKEKLTKAKIDFSFIIDEIKENPEAKEIKILR
jgi:large subunit ribosomal protein L18e